MYFVNGYKEETSRREGKKRLGIGLSESRNGEVTVTRTVEMTRETQPVTFLTEVRMNRMVSVNCVHLVQKYPVKETENLWYKRVEKDIRRERG